MSSGKHFNPRSSYEERRSNIERKLQRSFISIHAPHTRSDIKSRRVCFRTHISIHAPHTRSDLRLFDVSIYAFKFQSTLLIRGATRSCELWHGKSRISIHAPHTRSDGRCKDCRPLHQRISIHAPHTRSDVKLDTDTLRTLISIHAPHTRSDV